jgi:hypothetical protein
VQRHAHERRLHDLAPREGGLQRVAIETVQPRGEREVRRGRVLRLQRREPPDRLGGGEALAREQQLARGERRGELLARERPRRQLRRAPRR